MLRRGAPLLVHAAATANPGVLVVLAGDLNDTPGSPPLEALEGSGLLRVAGDLPADQQGTYPYGSTVEAIDHVLEATVPARYVPGSALVGRVSRSQSSSDHYPLRATFEVPR